MPRTEHSGNQEFGPLTPPGGKRQKEEEDSQLSSQLPVSPLLPSSSSPPLRLLSSVVLPLLPSPLPPDVVPPPRVVAAPPPPSVYAPLPHGWAIQKHHFVKRLGKLKFNLFFKLCIHKLNTVVKWCVKCEVCSLWTCHYIMVIETASYNTTSSANVADITRTSGLCLKATWFVRGFLFLLQNHVIR